MSSFRHPVGPQSSTVYWRRRALVIGVLLLIVVVVVLIVVGRGSGASSASAPGATTTATSSAAAEPTSPSGSSSSAPKSSASAAPGEPAACSDDQIELTPVLDKSIYGPTEDPRVAMSIKNTGSDDCHTDLGSAQQVLTISSGDEQYWSSRDCQTGGTNQDVTIKAGQELTTPAIEWDRTRSSTTTCDSSRPSVTAGGASYHLQVAVGDLESEESAQFVLN